jgi:hypothetical protein
MSSDDLVMQIERQAAEILSLRDELEAELRSIKPVRRLPWSNVVACLVLGATFFATAWKAPMVLLILFAIFYMTDFVES